MTLDEFMALQPGDIVTREYVYADESTTTVYVVLSRIAGREDKPEWFRGTLIYQECWPSCEQPEHDEHLPLGTNMLVTSGGCAWYTKI